MQGQPGITIPELAAKMGIKQNYLYRVLPGLEQENKVAQAGPRLAPEGLRTSIAGVVRRLRALHNDPAEDGSFLELETLNVELSVNKKGAAAMTAPFF